MKQFYHKQTVILNALYYFSDLTFLHIENPKTLVNSSAASVLKIYLYCVIPLKKPFN